MKVDLLRRMFPQKKIGIGQVDAARLLTYDFVLKWSGTLTIEGLHALNLCYSN